MTTPNAILIVKPIRQIKDWSSWAPSAAMLEIWKKGRGYSELEVATMADLQYVSMFNNDTGLSGPQFGDFLRVWG